MFSLKHRTRKLEHQNCCIKKPPTIVVADIAVLLARIESLQNCWVTAVKVWTSSNPANPYFNIKLELALLPSLKA